MDKEIRPTSQDSDAPADAPAEGGDAPVAPDAPDAPAEGGDAPAADAPAEGGGEGGEGGESGGE